jgi:hypothetical protein
MNLITDILASVLFIVLSAVYFCMLGTRVKESYQIYIQGKNFSMGSTLIPFAEFVLILLISFFGNSFNSLLSIIFIDANLCFNNIFYTLIIFLILTYLIKFSFYLMAK